MNRPSFPWVFLVMVFASNFAFGENCPVTQRGGIYGNDALDVVLPADGKFVFRPSGPGFIDHDGALGIKVGWGRKIRGELDVTGRRLDGSAPPARAYIPVANLEPSGQGSYVVFPTPGCWEIVASIGQRSLTFVVAVELIGAGPSSHLNGVPRGWRQTGG